MTVNNNVSTVGFPKFEGSGKKKSYCIVYFKDEESMEKMATNVIELELGPSVFLQVLKDATKYPNDPHATTIRKIFPKKNFST